MNFSHEKKIVLDIFAQFSELSLFDILKIDMIGNKNYEIFDATSKLLSFYIVCLERKKEVVSHSAHRILFMLSYQISIYPSQIFSLIFCMMELPIKINSFIMIYMIYCRWQDVSPYKPQVVSELGLSIKLMEHLHFGKIPAFLWLAWFM